MNKTWNTKYGTRRVREEPPTLEDAVFAARGLSDDPQQQAEIAAALIDMPVDKVRVAVLKASQKKDVNRVTFTTTRTGAERAVVVERKISRRPTSGYRPLGLTIASRDQRR
jgi:hypothetical protein